MKTKVKLILVDTFHPPMDPIKANVLFALIKSTRGGKADQLSFPFVFI